MATIAHEKLGHGFITEFTASGAEKQQVHLWQYEIAEKFRIKLSDTPRAALLREKWNILLGSSLYVEEGWATWIETHIMQRLAELSAEELHAHVPARAYTPDRVQAELRAMAEDGNLPDAVRTAAQRYGQLLRALFADTSPDAEQIHLAILELTNQLDAALGYPFQERFGQSPRYVMGYLLMEKLASKFGSLCVPYAVASACNVTYDLEQIANSDLARLIQYESSLNINTRFALLTHLPTGRKNDIVELLHQARDKLGFAPPFSLEGKRR